MISIILATFIEHERYTNSYWEEKPVTYKHEGFPRLYRDSRRRHEWWVTAECYSLCQGTTGSSIQWDVIYYDIAIFRSREIIVQIAVYYRCDILQAAPRQYHLADDSKHTFLSFETLWDLAIRRLNSYRILKQRRHYTLHT